MKKAVKMSGDVLRSTLAVYDRVPLESYARDTPAMRDLRKRFLLGLIDGDILDAGCGPGRDSIAFELAGRNVTGMDLSWRMLAEAQRLARDRGLKTIFRRGDFRNLQFPPDSFAGVWSCAVLHHYPADALGEPLQEFARVLKPGGTLCVTLEDRADHRGPNAYVTPDGRHFYLHTEELLSSQLEAASMLPQASQRTASSDGRTWLTVYSSKLEYSWRSGPTADKNCPFCWRRRFEENRRAGLPATSSVIWADDLYFLTPDVAPLAPGHILIVTVQHEPNYGAFSDNLDSQIVNLKANVRRLLGDCFDLPVAIVEHGPARPHESGACIDHAHFHCIPVHDSVVDAVAQRLGSPRPAQLTTLHAMHAAGQSYLYIDDPIKTGEWVFPVRTLEPQYLRRVISEVEGDGHWRWQTSCKLKRTKDTFYNTLECTTGRLNSEHNAYFPAGARLSYSHLLSASSHIT